MCKSGFHTGQKLSGETRGSPDHMGGKQVQEDKIKEHFLNLKKRMLKNGIKSLQNSNGRTHQKRHMASLIKKIFFKDIKA